MIMQRPDFDDHRELSEVPELPSAFCNLSQRPRIAIRPAGLLYRGVPQNLAVRIIRIEQAQSRGALLQSPRIGQSVPEAVSDLFFG